MKYLVAGAGGFIGGHLCRKLREEGHEVVAADIKPASQWYQVVPGCTFLGLCDLGVYENAVNATKNVEVVFNLAANMGGMGFIANNRVECMSSVLATTNLLRASYANGVSQFVYASSACVYNDSLQQTEEVSLKESDAWPADPEPGYGMEKLFGEELCRFYRIETGLETFIPRFHNIFGPQGTYDGGREKAPAAICRKVATAVLTGNMQIDIWGDGEQTRSFLYVDECIEGMKRIIEAGFGGPINLGSDELVSINQLVSMVEGIAGVELERHYLLDKPQGVRGRNSDNTLIRDVLGWSPSSKLVDGLEKTYDWILKELSAS